MSHPAPVGSDGSGFTERTRGAAAAGEHDVIFATTFDDPVALTGAQVLRTAR